MRVLGATDIERAAARGRNRRDSRSPLCGESSTSGSALARGIMAQERRVVALTPSCTGVLMASLRWQADMRPGAISRAPVRPRGSAASRAGSADGSGSPAAAPAATGSRPRSARTCASRRRRCPPRRAAPACTDDSAPRRVSPAGPDLDDAPEVHDDDAIADVPDDAEVVADEEVREVERARSSMKRFSTCAWIDTSSAATDSSQTRNSRLDRERARDADARALPAGELVRKAAHQRRIESDAVEMQADVFDLLRVADEAVHDRRLADDVDDAHPRIERRVRILEDHLHLELLLAGRAGGLARQRRALPEALPADGCRSPTAMRPSVDLPQPDSPTSPTTSPWLDGEIDAVDRVHDFLPRAGTKPTRRPSRSRCRALAHEALRHARELEQRQQDRRAGGGTRAGGGARSCGRCTSG